MMTDGECLQDQGNGLLCGHKKTAYFRVCDQQWPTATQLLLENGHHAATRTKNIAETNRDTAHALLWARGQHEFANSLARPHNARRIDGLVGGNENEPAASGFFRDIYQI